MATGFLALFFTIFPLGCAEEKAEDEKGRPLPAVYGTRVHLTTARAWVYAQGTAKAVRSKVLTFEKDGKIAYLRKGPDGQDLKVGDRVYGPVEGSSHGELLASLDNRDLAASISSSEAEFRQSNAAQSSAQSALDQAKAELNQAQLHLKRTKELVASGAGTQASLDEARTRYQTAQAGEAAGRAGIRSSKSVSQAQMAKLVRARVAMERSSIFAPFDGIIAYLNMREGDYFYAASMAGKKENDQLRVAPMVIIDPSEFEISVDIPAFDAARVQPGQTVYVVTGEDVTRMAQKGLYKQEHPDLLSTQGAVFSVSPSIDPGLRSTEVKIRTHNAVRKLRDGEFATCWILTDSSPNTIVAPFDGVIPKDGKMFGFAVSKNGVAERRNFVPGLRGLTGIEIVKGLQAGEVVVTKGRKRLSDGMKVDLVKVEEQTGTTTPSFEEKKPRVAEPKSKSPGTK